MENGTRTIKAFTDLHTWQEGHELVLAIYRLTKQFPQDEQFALVSQMRRAAVSITSNIAEGFGRSSTKDKTHFYVMARGSLTEIQNQLMIARDVQYIQEEDYTRIASQGTTVHKLFVGPIKSTKAYERTT